MPLNKIPDSLNELSVLDTKEADTKTITGTGENGTLPSVTWDNLPNGYDGKPIYYYVKEISYKLKDSNNSEKVYTLDSDGTYKCGDETGDFKPIYTGNGLNTGYSVEDNKVTGNVHIKNVSKLVVKKVWQDSNGEEITDNLPLEEIQFNLDGIKEDGTTVRLVTNGKLEASKKWLTVIDDSVLDSSLSDESKDLSQYKCFKVSEVITDVNRDIMYGYLVSDTYNVTDGSGEIVLTNKDKTPKDINVIVNKVWGDGNENHTNDLIDVVLIRSHRSLTSSELKGLNPDSLPEGITKVGENPVTLNNDNNWTKTWEELPYKEDNGTQNYYYVLEKSIPDDYEVSYGHNGSLSNPVITINNNVPGSFQVSKSWVNASGNAMTEGLPESIDVEIYQKLESTNSAVDETKKIPDNLKVYAEGDSITFGSESTNNMDYPNQLAGLLGEKSNVLNAGTPQELIEQINVSLDGGEGWNRHLLDSSYDVVTLIAGTNNILNTNDNIETMNGKMKNLIDSIYSHTEGKEIVLLVGGVPRITALDWPRREECNTGQGISADVVQSKLDSLVSRYNTMVKKLVESDDYKDKNIYYVDIYSAVGEQTADGCHPNNKGYKAIANAFYNKIYEHYVGKTATVETPKDIDGLPDNLGTPFKTETITPDANGNWSLNLTDLPKADANGNNYVYYVKEANTNSSWEVSYKHNGQFADNNTTIEIINTKETEKTDITVNKKWNDGDASGRPDSITLTLQRKTKSETEWSNVEVIQPTPTKNSNTWTYTYSNLPKDDGNGNNYQYKIVETVPTGYTVEYESNGIVNENNSINLTNTKSVSIKIKKVWSDGSENHIADTIKVKLYRSTTQNTELPLIMSITGNSTMKVDSTQTLSVSRNNVTWSSSDTNVATVDNSGVVTAHKAGTTTITARDGSETATFVITVSDKPAVQIANKTVNITLGENPANLVTLLGISMSDGSTATYSYSDYSNIVSIDNGSVTALKAGSTPITVTATSGSEETATINVGYPKFDTSESNVSVAKGGTLNIAPDQYGGFTYSVSGSSNITVDANGILSAENANAGDTATITVTRGTVTKTINVTVTEVSQKINIAVDSKGVTIPLNESNVKSIEIKINQINGNGNFSMQLVDKSGNQKKWLETIGVLQSGEFGSWNYGGLNPSISYNNGEAIIKFENLSATDVAGLQINAVNNITFNVIELKVNGQNVTGSGGGETGGNTGDSGGDSSDYGMQLSNDKGDSNNFKSQISGLKTGDKMTVTLLGNPNVSVNGCFGYAVNSWTNSEWGSKNIGSDGKLVIEYTVPSDYNGEYFEFQIWDYSNSTVSSVYYKVDSTKLRSTMKINYQSMLDAESSDTNDPNYYDTIPISASNSWTATLDGLEAYDENGQKYYYWVVEEDKNGYTASYYFDDNSDDTTYCIDATQLGNGEITIKNTKNESSSVTMPSTGGKGVKRYHVAGMAIMLVVSAVLIRRRKNPVK